MTNNSEPHTQEQNDVLLLWNSNSKIIKRQETNEKSMSFHISCLSIFDDLLVYSDIVTSVNQGRVICRLVSMFESVDLLVDESDRRRALVENMEDSEETLE